MADYPALPLWTDAYLADTHPDLTLEEHGCYMLLMMAAWRRPNCALPDDDAWFCRWLGVHGNKWRALRERVLERFFARNESGEFEQKRLRKERDFVEKRSRKQRENAEKRWSKHNTKSNDANDLGGATAYANAGNAPTPTPLDSSLRSESKPSSLRSEGSQRSGERVRVAVEIWNAECGTLPKVVPPLAAARKRKLLARLDDRFPDSESWRAYVRRIASTPFLRGENDRGWVATFDFAIDAEKCTRICEGKYDDRPKVSNGSVTSVVQAHRNVSERRAPWDMQDDEIERTALPGLYQ